MKQLQLQIVTIVLLFSLSISTSSAFAGMQVKDRTASIWTDKADYHPGENVTICGTSFLPNTFVSLNVTKLNDGTNTFWESITDANGTFETTYQIDAVGAPLYTVKATDGTNTATTTFTDPPIARIGVNARGTSITNSIPVTMGQTPTIGNVLIAVIGTERTTAGGARTVSSITETGVTWNHQEDEPSSNSPGLNVEIWLGIVSSGASPSISIALSGAPEGGAVADICEYSGIATTSYLDRPQVSTGSSATPITGTTSATTQPSELWIGGITVGAASVQSGATNGFTLLDGATFTSTSVAYLEKIVTATGTANSGTTISPATKYAGCIATFRAAHVISLSPASGAVGSSVSVSGSGLVASHAITATFNGAGVTLSGTTSTDSSGSFTGATFTVPASASGAKTVVISDGTNSPSASYTVVSAVSLNPTSGNVGDTVTVTATGMLGSHSGCTANLGGTAVTLSTSTTTSTGGLSATFTVPASTSGSKTFTLTDGTNSPTASFTVNSEITLSPTSGTVGSTVTVTATGMLGSHSGCTATFGGGAVTLSATTTTATGGLSATFTVPASTSGSKTFTLTDSTNSPTATYTVVSAVSLNPTSGAVGSSVSVSGSGLVASHAITATFNGAGVTLSGTTSTDSSGSFTGATFTVPASASGAKTVVISDGTNSPSASYTVVSAVSLNPTSGNVGDTVTVTATGMLGSHSGCTANLGGTAVTLSTSTTTSTGGLSATFTVPASTSGSKTFTLTDGTNSPTATFTLSFLTLGYTGSTSSGYSNSRNYFIADAVTPNLPFTVNSINAWGQNGGNCRVAIYDDLNGHPNNRLTSTITLSMSSSGAWSSASVTPAVNLAAGSTYWLVLDFDTTNGVGCYATANTRIGYSLTYPTNLPNPAGTTYTTINSYVDCIYLSGTATATVAAPTLNPGSTITYGSSVTSSVTLSAFNGEVLPSGTITFKVSTDGGSTYSQFGATKTLSSGSATSDPYTPSIAGTNYRFVAVYGGDTIYDGATGPAVSLIVNKASATVPAPTLNPSGSTATDTPVSLSVAISGAGAIPIGSATFQVKIGNGGWSPIGSAISLSSGFASTSYTPQTPANYQFQVVYSGDANYDGATGPAALLTVTDNIAPTTTAMITSGTLGNNGWYTTNVAFQLSATDDGGSGIKEIHYTINGVETVVTGSSATFTINIEASNTLQYWAIDNAANIETTHSTTVKIDKTAPTLVSSGATSQPNAAGWYRNDVTIHFIGQDSLSGLTITSGDVIISAEGSSESASWTFTDAASNSATFTVSGIKLDKTAPTITAPTNRLFEGNTLGGATGVALGIPAITDNLDTNVIATNDAPTKFVLGETTVTWTATDAAGNVATATQTVTVVDTSKPTITAPVDVSFEGNAAGGANVALAALGVPSGVSDIVWSGSGLVVTNNAPSFFSLGDTIVTWTVTDGSGNFKTATQTVTVVDTTKPSITAPANVGPVEGNAVGGASGVVLGSPVTSDVVWSSLTVTNDAPVLFPLGTTTVTWTVTDGSGNVATATQTVTVVDTSKPTITAPVDVSFEGNAAGGANVALAALGVPSGVSDIVWSGSGLVVTNNAPSFFSLGDTIVTWTVTDGSGNFKTATQTVTVVDTTKPSITAPANVGPVEGNAVGGASGVVLGSPVTSDVVWSSLTVTNDAPVLFPLGTTTVTWTVTDGSGNVATATQTVTVVDTSKPTITAPVDVSFEGNAAGGANVALAALGVPSGVSDIVWSGSGLVVTNNAPSFFSLGDTIVTWTVTDGSGNFKTATQTVTVVAILNHFVFNSIGSQTAGASFSITITAKDAFDNTVTGYIGTPTLSYSAGSITPSSATGGFSNGVWTGSVTATVASSGVTITATDDIFSGICTPFTVNAGSLSTVSISGPSSVIAGGAATFTATGYDLYGNSLGVQVASWSIPAGGDGGSWSGSVYTAHKAGTFTVRAVVSGKSGTAQLTVNAGNLAAVLVSGPSSVIAGGAATFTATGYDLYGNSLGVQVASWSIPAGGDGGSWSGSVYTAHKAGTFTVHADVSGVSRNTQLTVLPAPLDHITITPVSGVPPPPDGSGNAPSSSIVAGTSQEYVATAFDQYGNSWMVVASYSIDSGAGGSFSGSVYTSQIAGTWTVTGNFGGKSAQTTLSVTPAGLDHLSVSPVDVTVAAGVAQAYSVNSYDEFNNLIASGVVATFKVNGGAIVGSSVTETLPGVYTVEASFGGKTVSTSLTVTVAGLDHLSVSPVDVTVAAGVAQAYSVNSYDEFNNLIASGVVATFKVNGGAIVGSSVTETLPGVYTVEASFGGKTVSTSLTVTVAGLDHLSVSPVDVTVAAGVAQAYSVNSYDEFNNLIASGVVATFKVNGGAIVGSSVTETLPGVYTVEASFGGKTVSTSLTVTVAGLDHLSVSPVDVTVAAGVAQAYSVNSYDEFNNLIASGVVATFKVNGGAIVGSSVTETLPGVYTVEASFGGKTVSTSLTVTVAGLDHLSVSPVDVTVAAGVAQAYSVNSYDEFNNLIASGVVATFKVNGGAIVGSSVTETLPGVYTVEASFGGKTVSTSLTVTVAGLDHLSVSPVDVTVAAGVAQAYSVNSYDEFNNLIASGVVATFKVNGGAIVGSSVTETLPGVYTVEASFGGKTVSTSLTVTVAGLDHLSVSPVDVTVAAGVAQAYSVNSYDEFNNLIASGVVATFKVNGGAIVGSSVTETLPGVYTVEASFGGKTVSTSLTVTVAGLDHLSVSPVDVTVAAGVAQAYSVNSYDEFNNLIASGVVATFKVNGGAIVGSSVTETLPGVYTVEASFGGKTVSTSLTVTVAGLDHLSVSPVDVTVAAGVAQAYSVNSYDEFNNLIASGVVATFKVNGGAIVGSSVTETLPGVYTVEASFGGKTVSTSLTVTVAGLDHLSVSPVDVTVAAGVAQAYSVNSYDEFNNLIASGVVATFKVNGGAIVGSSVTETLPGVYTVEASFGGKTVSTSLTVTVAGLDHLSVSPVDVTVAAGVAQAYSVNSYDEFNNLIASGVVATFKVNGGAIVGSSVTETLPGVYTVEASFGGKTVSTSLTVTVAGLDHLSVSPVDVTVAAGVAQAYSVNSYDEFNNLIASGVVATFKVNGGAIVGSSVTETLPGVYTVEASFGGKTVSTSLTVTVAGLDHLSVSPVDVTVAAGVAQAYSVNSYDEFNNLIASGVVATFKVNGGAIVGSSVTETLPGVYTVEASFGGKTVSTSLTVTVAGLDHLSVSPVDVTVAAGVAQAYSVNSYDEFNNLIASGVVATFKVNGGAIVGSSVTETLPGVYTVEASFGGKTVSTSLTVTVAGLDHLSVSPVDVTVAAGVAQAYSVNSYDEFNNLIASGVVATFKVNGGAIVGSSVTETLPGVYTVEASFGGKTVSTSLTVTVAGLDHLSVSPVDVTVAAGVAQAYSVNSYDEFNNLIASGVVATFKVNGGAIVGSSVTETLPGVYTVEASFGGKTVSTSLTVTVAPLASIVISPKTASIVAGGSQVYAAEGFDQYGNDLGSVAASYSASVGATVTANSVSANLVGSYTVTATFGGKTDTATLTVTVAALDHMTIAPVTSSIVAGDSQAYSATGFDQFGNNWPVVATYSIDVGAGGSFSGNTYTSHTAGTWTVTGTFIGKSATATLTVTVPTTQVTLNLNSGWNMVSFTVIPADTSFASIFSGKGYYQVLTWTGTSYATPTNVEAGKGYWVLVLSPTTLTITGTPTVSYSINLPSGWSMIGGANGKTVDCSTIFTDYYQMLTWSGTNYVTATTMDSIKGYWVWVMTPTRITIG